MIGDDNTKWGPMFLLVANLLGFGCTEPPQPYLYRGMNLLDVEFVFVSEEHGAYPNTDILGDSTNPFPAPLFEQKWDVEAFGYTPASYYAWATQLAVEPIGDNQFYTAMALTNLYSQGMVDDYERYYVWKMAIQAHEALLIHFPDSVSYLADGVTNFPLAPLSYESLVTLGADVSAWRRVENADGSVSIEPSVGGAQ